MERGGKLGVGRIHVRLGVNQVGCQLGGNVVILKKKPHEQYHTEGASE